MVERQLPKLNVVGSIPIARSSFLRQDVVTGAIKEADWKIFKPLREIAIERFLQRVLDKIEALLSDPGKDVHARQAAIDRLMREQDKDLRLTFDDLRRSKALLQLACMRRDGLVSEEEYACFSTETRAVVDRILNA